VKKEERNMPESKSLQEICPCITERYRNAFISALSCSIADFEKLSANIAKHDPENKRVQDSVRMLINNYKKYRNEVESLTICGERKA